MGRFARTKRGPGAKRASQLAPGLHTPEPPGSQGKKADARPTDSLALAPRERPVRGHLGQMAGWLPTGFPLAGQRPKPGPLVLRWLPSSPGFSSVPEPLELVYWLPTGLEVCSYGIEPAWHSVHESAWSAKLEWGECHHVVHPERFRVQMLHVFRRIDAFECVLKNS